MCASNATYQRLQGEEILKKQEQVNKKKAELRQVRAAKADLLKERESEKMKLEKQEKEKRTLVTSLQKKQRGLQNEIAKKRREANQLNARIDRLIAEEIEKARKRAAEGSPSRSCRTQEGRCEDGQVGYGFRCIQNKGCSFGDLYHEQGRPRVVRRFCQYRGKLPMPISGAYIITSHYGQYAVEGLAQRQAGQ